VFNLKIDQSLLSLAMPALLLMVWLPSASAAEAAGEVTKMVGRASAATLDGDIRALKESSAVNAGDTVVTSTNSFVRMKLSDGAYVMLRPNTRFQIEDYQYAENANEGRSIFNLLKGGFRAITGAIGQRNHASVSFRTAVATIGIRGTDLEVIDCSLGCPDISTTSNPGLYFKVHEGGIDVNGKGFDQNTGGFMPPGGEPTELDFNAPNNPLNADPTPSADPEDCL
jgi:FecR protein